MTHKITTVAAKCYFQAAEAGGKVIHWNVFTSSCGRGVMTANCLGFGQDLQCQINISGPAAAQLVGLSHLNTAGGSFLHVGVLELGFANGYWPQTIQLVDDAVKLLISTH
jgi:hypothetical protein